MTADAKTGQSAFLRVMVLLALLFLFLSSINMLGSGLKMTGEGVEAWLTKVTGNPFAALMTGVLCTAIVQSSSLTTSIVVGLVSSGQLEVVGAVPIIMGANIGTTITCTLVALGFVGRRGRFRRAFAAGTMHDFFNILTVIILFPIELVFHPLARAAEWFAVNFADLTKFSSPESPLKTATHFLSDRVKNVFVDGLSMGQKTAGILMAVVALLFLFVSLYFLTGVLKGFMATRMESLLDRFIFRSPLLSLLLGLVFTAVVQSSSVTTSVAVPLVAAGVLRLEQVFPYTMGANIGTTVTAFLAALGTGNPHALAIASTHTLFNLVGVAIFFPVRRIRNIPIFLATTLASLTLRSRWYAILYIFTMFIALPLLFVYLWG